MSILVCLGLVSWLGGTASPAGADQARTWRVDPSGITFELTASDLRAWRGDAQGAPVFSASGILAEHKKEFDADARERAGALVGPDAPTYPDYTMDQSVTLEMLSVVGTLVVYRENGGGYAPGAAHPSGYEVLRVVDVARKDARPSLLDFYSEAQMVRALKADPFVSRFGNPEKGFASARSLEQLLASLDSEWATENSEPPDNECGFEVSFGPEMMRQFYFHDVVKDRVAVRILVAPGNEWCNRTAGPTELGLLLPMPPALRDHLLKAQRGEAGFLNANRKAAGAREFSDHWTVDLRTLVRKKR